MFGLDIETDTSIDGLDPRNSAIVAVAIAGDGWTRVLDSPEPELIASLDETLAEMPDGVIVTWNGAGFDLPFIADRAKYHGVEIGLQLKHDPCLLSQHEPLPGHTGRYRAAWYGHQHLDAYPLYRSDVGAFVGLPCGLKSLARFVGLKPVEVDRESIHDLDETTLRDYVVSDAVLTRELALRRWPTASRAIDPALS